MAWNAVEVHMSRTSGNSSGERRTSNIQAKARDIPKTDRPRTGRRPILRGVSKPEDSEDVGKSVAEFGLTDRQGYRMARLKIDLKTNVIMGSLSH